MSIKKPLYSIRDIHFNPEDLESRVSEIIKLFVAYNNKFNNAIFNTQFFSMQMLKYEARNSNEIEGIYTSHIEILTRDTPTSKKITNYVTALKNANKEINKNSFFTENLILQIHKDLFENIFTVDAIAANPGSWRTKQVQIANHFPPKPQDVPKYIKEFLEWLNDPEPFKQYGAVLEALVKGSIAHAYFEKIHPFSDGNGRTGRILFNLVLNKYQLTNRPYFYISKAILHDQFTYYMQLAKLDNSTNYQKWIEFFLDTLIYQLKSNIKVFDEAAKMVTIIRKDITKEDNEVYREIKKRIFDYISKYPIFTYVQVYNIVKPFFRNIEDNVFVNVFNQIVENFHIRKIPNTDYFEFKTIIDIIVGSDY
ncbi:hypothetical protein SHELI_v1c01680 [Spiroplasma helicoides]|uniref:Fido domain-containing protein n=1 Tax=Spiroplasma helicoides TaxID=216938 RepID=A0A1B3SJL0_9MOLU|nr:Fic family protein [Spiroplasma helicoides]AOG60123.1 hypothetical protein SHELI_v1c01680 [Spiroplasma helicoides]